MPISGFNHRPHPLVVYASNPALPRRSQDSLPTCLLGFDRFGLSPTVIISFSQRTPHAAPVADRILRTLGRNSHLDPDFRESACYNVARLAGAVAGGPRHVLALCEERASALAARLKRKANREVADIEPFEKRRGSHETELFFAHLVAELSYHPQPYDSELIVVWATEQKFASGDPAFGWSALAPQVRVVPMGGGHVSPLFDRSEELGRIVGALLA